MRLELAEDILDRAAADGLGNIRVLRHAVGKRAAPSGSSATMPAGSVTSGKTASMLTCHRIPERGDGLYLGPRLGSIPLPRVPENASKVHCPSPTSRGSCGL